MQQALLTWGRRCLPLAALLAVVLAITALAVTSAFSQEADPNQQTAQPSGQTPAANDSAAPQPGTQSDVPAADAQAQTSQEGGSQSTPGPESNPAPPAAANPRAGWRMSWDNTFKYSNAFRVAGRSPTLIDPALNPLNANQDDGDRAFHGGLVSNRVDLLTEMDIVHGDGNFGFRASAAAWADSAYSGHSDNNSPFTFNPVSVPHYDFTSGTRDLHFARAELLDAFMFGKVNFGKEGAITMRGGQYALQWGESLFFGNNGIAGTMAPIDVIKLLAVPGTQFKELIRPVPQVSAQVQFTPTFAIGAYYQFYWQKTRLPAVGSYYSSIDILEEGGERLLAGPPLIPGGGPAAFLRRRDLEPKDGGQFGFQVKLRPGRGYDVGFYFTQYHDKTPQLYLKPSVFDPGGGAPPIILDPPNFNPVTGQIGTYFLAYPENIKTYGMSATKTIGNTNFAAEISGRTNMPLVSDAGIVLPGLLADNNKHPLYAVGDSLHVNVSALSALGPNFISRESTILAELAWNNLLSITKNASAIDPNATKNAVGFRLIYEPMYRQVFAGTDISFPIGLAFFPMGKSSVINTFGPDKGGDFSAGMSVAFRDVWRFTLGYNRYYGEAAGTLDASNHFNFKQPLRDRDVVTFSVRRTFGIRAGGTK